MYRVKNLPVFNNHRRSDKNFERGFLSVMNSNLLGDAINLRFSNMIPKYRILNWEYCDPTVRNLIEVDSLEIAEDSHFTVFKVHESHVIKFCFFYFDGLFGFVFYDILVNFNFNIFSFVFLYFNIFYIIIF